MAARRTLHEGRHDGFHKGMHDGVYFPGLGPVSKQLEQLKLDDKQQALVKTAQDSQRGLRDAMRAAGAKRHDLLKSQLDSGKLDPRALISQSEQNRGQFDTQMKQARDQWLAVWDSLNDAQRSQVASMLKERQARMEQRHARMQERHGRALPRPRPRLRQRRLQPPTKRRFRRLRRATRAPAWPPGPDAPAFGAAVSGARAGRVPGHGCWDVAFGTLSRDGAATRGMERAGSSMARIPHFDAREGRSRARAARFWCAWPRVQPVASAAPPD